MKGFRFVIPLLLLSSFCRTTAVSSQPVVPKQTAARTDQDLIQVDPVAKCSPQLTGQLLHSPKRERFILLSDSLPELTAALSGFRGNLRWLQTDSLSQSVVVECSGDLLRTKLLPLSSVRFADRHQKAVTEVGIIGYHRSFHGISAVDYRIPGANGNRIVAGVKEQRMEALDLDLHQRVLSSSLAAPVTEPHATVIASIIGGAGNSFYDGRGVAPACRFFSSSFANLFADNSQALRDAGVSVQNHSYGTIVQSFYGAEAVSYDAQSWQMPYLQHVFSAGNRGSAAAQEGRYAGLTGFANLTGNFKMAKNVITVGALTNTGQLAAESSSGPLYDGRLAPQLVALGPNGTSDAAAMVSGTIAVLQQVYADSNGGQLPPSSLLRALLFSTARDLHRPGIDYKSGYGELDAYAAVKTLQGRQYSMGTLSPGQTWISPLVLPTGLARLCITLCWNDSAAAPNNNRALLNDLDLELVELSSGTIYQPWVLSAFPHPDSLLALPRRGRDTLQTSEQISLLLPPAGNYEIRVKGTLLNLANLPFSVAWKLDTLGRFRFVAPQHPSDILISENPLAPIRWATPITDSSHTGRLQVSFDRGQQWELIGDRLPLYTGIFNWTIRDTVSPVRFRMQTAFGEFQSPDVMLGPLTRLRLDFLCADSFRLSWNRNPLASAYRLYTLTDSPYLAPRLILSDSFVVINRSAHPELVYAVEPLLGNGLPAPRSLAIDIRYQQVNCFYTGFYHTLQDDNRLTLVLELGAPEYVDSVFFERVWASGQLIQTLDRMRVSDRTSRYSTGIQVTQPGTQYWRARLRVKNGGEQLTETIAVTTSGGRKLFLYPNPVSGSLPISVLRRQGLGTEARLIWYDVQGRKIRSYDMIPDTVPTGNWLPGIYFYQLISVTGQVLESGRVLVQ